MPLKYALCMETVLLAWLTSFLSKSGCTDTQQTAQSAREAQSTLERLVPKVPPYSICIGTHTYKNMHCVLKGFPDTGCILLSFKAANQQRNVSSRVLVL